MEKKVVQELKKQLSLKETKAILENNEEDEVTEIHDILKGCKRDPKNNCNTNQNQNQNL